MLDKIKQLNDLLDKLEDMVGVVELIRKDDPEAWAQVRERYLSATSKFNDAASEELAKREGAKREGANSPK